MASKRIQKELLVSGIGVRRGGGVGWEARGFGFISFTLLEVELVESGGQGRGM